MLRRIGYLAAITATVLASAAVIHRYFSDILPLASTEPPTIWRLETALLLAAAQWVALAIAALAAISLIVLLWRASG